MLKHLKRLSSKSKNSVTPQRKKLLTEDEAWAIWSDCGKLAGVDYYDYAVKIITAYEQKNIKGK
jgi:hypothetical protein